MPCPLGWLLPSPSAILFWAPTVTQAPLISVARRCRDELYMKDTRKAWPAEQQHTGIITLRAQCINQVSRPRGCAAQEENCSHGKDASTLARSQPSQAILPVCKLRLEHITEVLRGCNMSKWGHLNLNYLYTRSLAEADIA